MTSVQLIEIQSSNIIGIRILKTRGANDGGFHRTTIQPGDDQNKVLAAVNADLQAMGIDQISAQEWAPVVSMVATKHTPAVIAAFEAARAKATPPDNPGVPGNVTIA